MYLLQNSHWQAGTLLRGLLAIIFMFWLASVMTQYNEQKPAFKPEITTDQSPRKIVIKQLALPPVPNAKITVQKRAPAKPAELPAKLPAEILAKPTPRVTKVANQSPAAAQVKIQQVEQVYKKLSDTGVDIQIAWPRNAKERQATLRFMYQCAGVQFAVLNGSTLRKISQTGSNTDGNYSDWVRVAQGSLSKKEQHWLNAYALTGTPIRLFPQEIDFRLSQHLANTLKGSPLVHLRALYQVTNQTLVLNNIELNHQAIKGSWPLYQGKCD